ncbi:MAG: DsbA family protein [Bacteroidetes bacterium]|nr:DsbA family protein [Bacteroidota bacterium]
MERPKEEKPQKNNSGKQTAADGIEIIYYTDPLCCWSWAMEPQWLRFLQELGPSLTVTYKMGGLLPSWKNFNDSVTSIRKPIHMGPEWMHAKHVSGVDIDNQIWITDPPASSFPACIAVKSAGLQSAELGAAYLYLARKAVMQDGVNIARTEALISLANTLSKEHPSFDVPAFRNNLLTRGLEAFKTDWQQTKFLGITRFPTLIFKIPGRTPIRLTGYQSYETLIATIK